MFKKISVLVILVLVIGGVIVLNNQDKDLDESKVSNDESISQSDNRLPLDPGDFENDDSEIIEIREQYSLLNQCRFDQVFATDNLDLGFLSDYGVQAQSINIGSTFDLISNSVNELIQQEVRYLLVDGSVDNSNLVAVGGEAGIILLPINQPKGDGYLEAYSENLKSFQIVLGCS